MKLIEKNGGKDAERILPALVGIAGHTRGAGMLERLEGCALPKAVLSISRTILWKMVKNCLPGHLPLCRSIAGIPLKPDPAAAWK